MAQKKVLIIGATSGIGKELARIYVSKGWKVAVTGRREKLLDELQQQYGLVTACFDVTEKENKDHLEKIITHLGGLDLLIYNAGFGDPSEELKWDTERLTTLTNVNGFIEIVNYAFNYFVSQGFGQIAATSSVAALRGNGHAPAYGASKAFMSNYAEGLNIKANKLKKDVVVTDIRPGFVDTKMAKARKRFWVSPITKAAMQIVKAIEKKKRVAYITKRWWFVAQIMKLLPYSIYKRIG